MKLENMKKILSWVALAIISAVIGALINSYIDKNTIVERLAKVESSVANLNNIDGKTDKIYEGLANNQAEIKAMRRDVDSVYEYVHLHVIKLGEGALSDSINDSLANSQSVVLFDEISAEKIEGIDMYSGEIVSAEELINKKSLLFYEEDSNIIIFYGLYNESYHWDGNCLINTYSDGELVYISDAIYDDGKLLSSVDAYQAKIDHNKVNAWSFFDRKCFDGYNYGNIRSYRYTVKNIKFDLENISVVDLIYPEEFEENINTELLSFYHGRTYSGKETDDTGTAYMVKYEDGYIRTLYIGNMKDGAFHDNGKALEIVYDADNYMYFKYEGSFTEDRRDHNEKEYFSYLNTAEISFMLQDKYLECPLKWK